MRRMTALAMVAVLALAVTACGSDGGTEATSGASTTVGDGASDDTTDGTIDDGVLSGLVDEDCQFLLAGAFLNPLVAAQSGSDADLEESAAQLEAIAAEAPDEIQDAMATLSEGYAQLAEALKDIDLSDPQSYTDPDVQAALQDLEGVFDADYEAASQTVSDYVADNCSG